MSSSKKRNLRLLSAVAGATLAVVTWPTARSTGYLSAIHVLGSLVAIGVGVYALYCAYAERAGGGLSKLERTVLLVLGLVAVAALLPWIVMGVVLIMMGPLGMHT